MRFRKYIHRSVYNTLHFSDKRADKNISPKKRRKKNNIKIKNVYRFWCKTRSANWKCIQLAAYRAQNAGRGVSAKKKDTKNAISSIRKFSGIMVVNQHILLFRNNNSS